VVDFMKFYWLRWYEDFILNEAYKGTVWVAQWQVPCSQCGTWHIWVLYSFTVSPCIL